MSILNPTGTDIWNWLRARQTSRELRLQPGQIKALLDSRTGYERGRTCTRVQVDQFHRHQQINQFVTDRCHGTVTDEDLAEYDKLFGRVKSKKFSIGAVQIGRQLLATTMELNVRQRHADEIAEILGCCSLQELGSGEFAREGGGQTSGPASAGSSAASAHHNSGGLAASGVYAKRHEIVTKKLRSLAAIGGSASELHRRIAELDHTLSQRALMRLMPGARPSHSAEEKLAELSRVVREQAEELGRAALRTELLEARIKELETEETRPSMAGKSSAVCDTENEAGRRRRERPSNSGRRQVPVIRVTHS